MAPPALRPSPAFSGEAPPLRLRAAPPCGRLLPSCARQPGRTCEMPSGPPGFFSGEEESCRSRHDLAASDLVLLPQCT